MRSFLRCLVIECPGTMLSMRGPPVMMGRALLMPSLTDAPLRQGDVIAGRRRDQPVHLAAE